MVREATVACIVAGGGAGVSTESANPCKTPMQWALVGRVELGDRQACPGRYLPKVGITNSAPRRAPPGQRWVIAL